VAARDETARRAASRVAVFTRHRGPDDPEVARARHDLHVARAAEHLRRVAADLTAEDRAQLAAILRDGHQPTSGVAG
jgi:hypothetical protein